MSLIFHPTDFVVNCSVNICKIPENSMLSDQNRKQLKVCVNFCYFNAMRDEMATAMETAMHSMFGYRDQSVDKTCCHYIKVFTVGDLL